MKKLVANVWKLIVWCWNNSVLRYIFLGGCATLVNLGCYYILRVTTSLNLNVANIISIAVAIVFAYFTNSRFVFMSEAKTILAKFSEFVKFVSARLSTMAIEVGGVWLMVDMLKMNDYLAKLLIQIIVLILNYVFSKLFVFKKK